MTHVLKCTASLTPFLFLPQVMRLRDMPQGWRLVLGLWRAINSHSALELQQQIHIQLHIRTIHQSIAIEVAKADVVRVEVAAEQDWHDVGDDQHEGDAVAGVAEGIG